jgi:hypothetical protein
MRERLTGRDPIIRREYEQFLKEGKEIVSGFQFKGIVS